MSAGRYKNESTRWLTSRQATLHDLGMGKDEEFALNVQLKAMRQYLKALDYRIEQWTKRTEQ